MADFGFTTISGATVSFTSLFLVGDFQLFLFLMVSSVLLGILFSNIKITKKQAALNLVVVFFASVLGTVYFEANYFVGLLVAFVLAAKPSLINDIIEIYVDRFRGNKK